MALQKAITSKYGVECNYHRIISLANLDFENSEVNVVVGMYESAESRLTEIYPIQTNLFIFEIPTGVDTLTYGDIRAILYQWLTTLPMYQGATEV